MRRASFSFLSRPWLVAGSSLLVVAGLTLFLWSPWEKQGITRGKTLKLYCAAGLSKPVEKIIEEYEREYRVHIEPTFGAAGDLESSIRIQNGAGDLFLSSDGQAMELAKKNGLIAETIPVAVLRPVLVVNKKTQSKLRDAGKSVLGLTDLLRGDLHVVLCNPQSATIGKLAERALPPDIWKSLEERLGQSGSKVSHLGTVMQVAQAVRDSDDYVGIVWSANALQLSGLDIITPPEFKGTTEQAVIGVLKGCADPTAALQFARFLSARDKGLAVFKEHHYEPVAEADDWAEVPKVHLSLGAMLLPAVSDAILAFEKREGVKIDTDPAGCGLLVSKMKGLKKKKAKGDFPDGYFSCDQSFLDMVQPWFGPGEQIARNDMVLIVPKGNPGNVKTLADLAKDVRVGFAHPVNSAIGKLTDDLLKKSPGLHAEVYRKGRKHDVVHFDAAHTLVNQVHTRALDAAIVYVSNVKSADESTQKRIEVIDLGIREAQAVQPFAISKETRHPQLMRRLQAALTNADQEQRLRKLGFHWLYAPQ